MNMLPDHTLFDADDAVARHERKSLFRFIVCGSVDHGKSTLIGRLLYESGLVLSDQLQALSRSSAQSGQSEDLDFSLLLDGLAAEREQKITIDVAYRFFATARRKYIVADAPGHEQYTRNMATGASTADLALLLVSAVDGLTRQTRRHAIIVSTLGVRRFVIAVNKMDLVGWSESRFAELQAEFRTFLRALDIDEMTFIPLSAREGDNLVYRSRRMSWYQGPSLLESLETVDVESRVESEGFRMPVQYVNRPDSTFRGYCGLITSGKVYPGMPVKVLPSGPRSQIARIVTADGDLAVAGAGQAITVTLSDDIDVSRGDVISDCDLPPAVVDRLHARLVWIAPEALVPGRSYLIKLATLTATATIEQPLRIVDLETNRSAAAERLAANDIGTAVLKLDRLIAADRYVGCRDTGSFILIDPDTGDTIALGTIEAVKHEGRQPPAPGHSVPATSVSPLPASGPRTAPPNVFWHRGKVTQKQRAQQFGHTPMTVWLTGLSGAGKSTIAYELEGILFDARQPCVVLDGDNIRHHLNNDLGFSEADRKENIRRIAEVARLMNDVGLIVVTAFISPYRADRAMAREIIGSERFVEVHVSTSAEICEARDPKGLYAKARRGQIPQFTGISSPYEAPLTPALCLDTGAVTPQAATAALYGHMVQRMRSGGERGAA